MGFLTMILFFVGVIGVALIVVGLIEWVDWKLIIIGILIALICWFSISAITDNAPYRDIFSNNIIVEYARVNLVTERTITLDNDTYAVVHTKALDDTFNKLYPINLNQFEVGDIVKYQYIKTDFNEYVIKIDKVN
jgi:hypothetical protein